MTHPISHSAVIVVNYGSHELVKRNLTSSLAGLDMLIVVVDNFTSPLEQEAVATVARDLAGICVFSPVNVGFGAGIRLGIARAREDGATTFLVLNPDARLDPEGVIRLLERVAAQPRELVAPLVVRPDGTGFAELQDLYLTDGRMRASRSRPAGVPESEVVRWISGACFAISAELWDASGGYDDDYFLYWEDVDLSVRVWAAGGSVLIDDTITAIHDEGATHGFARDRQAKSPIYYYYNIRNRLLFAAKHLDAPARRRWRRVTPRIALLVLLQGGRRQFLHPARTLVPALRGIRDGRRILRLAPRTGGARGTNQP